MTSKNMKAAIAMALIMLFVFAPYVFCVEWKATNQATVQWDAVTTLDDGSALPAGTTIKYRVYLTNALTDPNKENPALLGETDALEYVLTLNTEGKYLVGVRSVRFDNTVEVGTSAINWSDVNGEATPNPFGLVHYLQPATPMNLR